MLKNDKNLDFIKTIKARQKKIKTGVSKPRLQLRDVIY